METIQLNPSDLKSKYAQNIDCILNSKIPKMIEILNIKDIGKYLPIQDFFRLNFIILRDLYITLKNSIENGTNINIKQITRPFGTWAKDIFYHYDLMIKDFQENQNETFIGHIQDMVSQNIINLKFWNMEMGLIFLDNLEKHIIVPLTHLFSKKLKKHRKLRKILILSKKLEYMNKSFFKVHLTSFYNVSLNYKLKNKSEDYKNYIDHIVISNWHLLIKGSRRGRRTDPANTQNGL